MGSIFRTNTALFSSSYCNMPHGLSSYGLVVLYPCCNNLPWQTGFFCFPLTLTIKTDTKKSTNGKFLKGNFFLDLQGQNDVKEGGISYEISF